MSVELSKSRQIARPPAALWEVLADFEGISAWAGNVDHSTAVTEPSWGVDAGRRVQAGRITLLEEVVEWQPPTTLAYRLIGLPPPAGSVITRWSLAAHRDGTLVTITTTINPLPGPPGKVVSKVLSRQLASAADTMLTGLEEATR